MHENESVSNDNIMFNGERLQIQIFLFSCTDYLDVSQPKGEWKTEDIATVGELLLDVSIQLART